MKVLLQSAIFLTLLGPSRQPRAEAFLVNFKCSFQVLVSRQNYCFFREKLANRVLQVTFEGKWRVLAEIGEEGLQFFTIGLSVLAKCLFSSL